MQLGYLVIVVAAVAAVSIADVFLKQASESSSFVTAMRSPWFWGAICMYLFQVIAFTYLFLAKVELSLVGVMQTALYASVVVGAGVFIYKESLSPTQYVGVGLALTGVVLLNVRP